MVRRRENQTTDAAAHGMADTIFLTMPTTSSLRPVATLVLGGLGSRLGLPYERVDDLQLAVLSALSASSDEIVHLECTADDDSLGVDIGPLTSGTAADPALRRVLDPLVDTVRPAEREGREWLTLRISRQQAGI